MNNITNIKAECVELISTAAGRKKLGLSSRGKEIKDILREYFKDSDFESDIERIFAIVNDLKNKPKCKVCGKPTKLFSLTGSFSVFCSRKCSWNSEETMNKRTNTSIQKFGVEHFSKTEKFKTANSEIMKHNSELIQAKRSKTLQDNFGTLDNAYKVIHEKMKYGIVKKFGVDNYSKIRGNTAVKTRKDNYKDKLPSILLKLKEDFGVTPVGWDESTYTTSKCEYEWEHTCGNKFYSHFNYANIKPICRKCFPAPKSQCEAVIYDFLKRADVPFIQNTRKVISPLELDFYIPHKNLAIEINGVYWHREELNRTPLITKTQMCSDKGIKLLHFWDWEIKDSPDIVKSMIMSKLGIFKNTIYARNTIVREISSSESSKFINENHLQGAANAAIHIGSFYKNKLVAVMTFGKSRFNKNYEYELIRFCCLLNTRVVGIFSKMLKFANIKSLISYCDLRYSDGDVYRKCGFTLLKHNSPSYFWFKGDNRLSRYQTQKHRLHSVLKHFNPALSEAQNMINNNWAKVYDCGTLTWHFGPKVI